MDYTYTNPQQQQQQSFPNAADASSTYFYQQPQLDTFNRSTEGFPRSVLDRATAAKLRLEHYYKTALDQAFERNQRYGKNKQEY
jgi:protein-serine/threonine kinase